MMKKVNDKIDDYQAFLNQWLYYDKEEIDNAGFEELGRQKAKKETARKMLEKNFSITDIMDCTGLTLNQIEKLKEKE